MNIFIFMGRLTKEPEIRYSKENTAVARFTVAVDRRFTKDTTDFFDCTAFGKTAEFIEKYLTKGTKVVVTGNVQNNNYKDKDGKMHYSTAFIVNEVEFAESKKKEEPKEEPEFMNVPEDETELPFI